MGFDSFILFSYDSRLPVGSYIWLLLVDVLEHSNAVLTWLLALRGWIILCSNVPMLSDSMKQTTLPCLVCPVFVIHTQTHTTPSLVPKQSAHLFALSIQFPVKRRSISHTYSHSFEGFGSLYLTQNIVFWSTVWMWDVKLKWLFLWCNKDESMS